MPVVVVSVLLWSSVAEAVPVTYLEEIFDTALFGRDVVRRRMLQIDAGPPVFTLETNEVAIIEQNTLSVNFGFLTARPISLRHIFIPVLPVDHFLFAAITLGVSDPDGSLVDGSNNDVITLGGVPAGLVNAGNGTTTSTTLFTTSDPAIAFGLADGFVDVSLIPILEFDGFEARGSRMVVVYETDSPTVPEPAATSLLLPALVALIAWRRQLPCGSRQ